MILRDLDLDPDPNFHHEWRPHGSFLIFWPQGSGKGRAAGKNFADFFKTCKSWSDQSSPWGRPPLVLRAISEMVQMIEIGPPVSEEPVIFSRFPSISKIDLGEVRERSYGQNPISWPLLWKKEVGWLFKIVLGHFQDLWPANFDQNWQKISSLNSSGHTHVWDNFYFWVFGKTKNLTVRSQKLTLDPPPSNAYCSAQASPRKLSTILFGRRRADGTFGTLVIILGPSVGEKRAKNGKNFAIIWPPFCTSLVPETATASSDLRGRVSLSHRVGEGQPVVLRCARALSNQY